MNKGIYRPKTIVSRYYTLLFTLPKWQVLVVVLISLSVILLSTMNLASIPIILNSLIVFIALKTYSLLYRDTVFYKLKRQLGLSLAVLVYTAIYTLITREPLVSIVSSTALITVVFLGLDGTVVYRFILVIAPPTTTLFLSMIMGLYPPGTVLYGVLSIFTLVFLDILIYVFMARRRVNGISFPDLGTLFLRNWLDRRIEIEEAFDELGEYGFVNPRVLKLGDLLVVYTDVHYGPFSNIGSSRLPCLLKKHMGNLGYLDVIPLHGLGSHDRNIVSSKYVNEYIDQLTNTMVNGNEEKLLYHDSFVVDDGEWRILGLVFDKLTMLFISRRLGIDDLPYSIQLDYEVKSRAMGLGDVVLIDTHNWESSSEIDVGNLNKLLDKALVEISKTRGKEPVEVLYRYRCFETKAPGLVNDEACILCIKGEERREVCLLYLRGNNMKPGARDLVLDALRELDVDYYEVFTNDEHSETGTRAYIAYIPVHESTELLDSIRRVSRELKGSGYKSGARMYSVKMNIKLMGSSMLEIRRNISIGLMESSILLLLYVFLTPIALSTLI